MNKRALKSYFSKTREDLKNKYIYYKRDSKASVLISNSFSIVELFDDNLELDKMDEKIGNSIIGLFEGFESLQVKEELDLDINTKEEHVNINDRFSINSGALKKLHNIIKFDKIEIVESVANWDITPIIRIENTKTKNKGYLLPERRY